jgi:hypothetical protein
MASAYPEIRQNIAANREPPMLYEPPARDARSLAAAALARQPARSRMVETAPDTPQTAYSRSASPVAAYAPAYSDGGAVSTGRGLY